MSGVSRGQDVWNGHLVLTDGEIIDDLKFSYNAIDDNTVDPKLPPGPIHLLAVVDPNRIPLHLVAGPNLNVLSGSAHTLNWLSDALQCKPPTHNDIDPNSVALEPQIYSQCPVAVLAKVSSFETSDDVSSDPRITEILLYAVQTGNRNSVEEGSLPGHDIYALPLSSDLLYANSSYAADIVQPTSDSQLPESENLPPVPESAAPDKKGRLSDIFDAASDRRKRAKTKGGASTSLAASRSSGTPQSLAFDGRPIKSENTTDDTKLSVPRRHNPAAAAAAARRVAPITIASSRPSSRANASEDTKPPFRAQQGFGFGFVDSSFDARNRQVISRTVMAGMRIYGLQQQRKPGRAAEDADGVSASVGEEQGREQDDTDAEYKGVYHQAYRGTVFAFRHRIAVELLAADAVREIVDRLLALFCQEPP